VLGLVVSGDEGLEQVLTVETLGTLRLEEVIQMGLGVVHVKQLFVSGLGEFFVGVQIDVAVVVFDVVLLHFLPHWLLLLLLGAA
jgi:hypothetical protein